MIRSKNVLLAGILLSSQYAIAEVEFNEHVMPLIESNCVTCHSEEGVSFSFEDPDVTYNFRMAIASAVKDDRMPPWLAEPGHENYVDDYSLTSEQKALVAEWAAAGFPRDETKSRVSVAVDQQIFEADITMAALRDAAYLPDQENKDDYRCFIVDWPYEEDKYVTGFLAEPGNLRVAHHLVAHMIAPESVEFIKMLSEEEEGPGHQCFGGPLPDRMGDKAVKDEIEKRYPGEWEKLTENNYWLSHWAPGMYGIEFPEDTGILMRPGSAVVVQMHYYSAFAPGETDIGTMMQFQVADEVKKPSINHPLTKGKWLFGKNNESMLIEAGGEATYEVSEDFSRIANYTAQVLGIEREEIAAIELQSANVHMHAFGASGSTSLLDSDGEKHTLLNIPNWDLDWQRDFMFTEGKIISSDDFDRTQLIVECNFSNYTNETVYGGYGSDDEMCFNFSYMSVILSDDEGAAVADD